MTAEAPASPEMTGIATPTIEDRVTVPEEPGQENLSGIPPYLYFMEGYQVDPDAVWVTESSALTYSAIWACVWLISQTVAGLGWHCYERLGKGKGKEPLDPSEDDVAWLLDTEANEEMSAFDWRQVTLKDALTCGNGYSEIERDGMGRPRAKYRIDPNRACPDRLDNGRLYYEIENGSGVKNTALPAASVYHLKGPGPDGLVGYSVIAAARKSIELSMSTEQYGRTWSRRGPMPGGTLEIPGNVKKEERDEIRSSFQKTYGGSKNAGRVIALTAGMKFTPLSIPNTDMQWLESRAFNVEDVCRWYGVPQTLINKLDRSTYNNIESLNSFFVQYCLLAWCRRLETEADRKLYGQMAGKRRGMRYTKLNLNTLLRGDSKTQVDNLTRLVTSGLETINEARALLDMNPVPEGESLLVQGAMIPVASLLQPVEDGNTDKPAEKPTDPDKPTKPAKGDKAAAADGNVQATALNGAQVTSLQAMLINLAMDQLPAETVRAALRASYPLMAEEDIDTMVDELETWRKTRPKPEPAPEKGGNPGEKPPEETETEDEPEETSDTPPAKAKADNSLKLLASAYSRLYRVEADKARRAANKGQLTAHAAAFYGPENIAHIAAELTPVIALALEATGQSCEKAAHLAKLAATNSDRVSRELLAEGFDGKRWEERAGLAARATMLVIQGA